MMPIMASASKAVNSYVDDDGCNWSETVMLNSAGSNEPYVIHKAQEVVHHARKLFNLE